MRSLSRLWPQPWPPCPWNTGPLSPAASQGTCPPVGGRLERKLGGAAWLPRHLRGLGAQVVCGDRLENPVSHTRLAVWLRLAATRPRSALRGRVITLLPATGKRPGLEARQDVVRGQAVLLVWQVHARSEIERELIAGLTGSKLAVNPTRGRGRPRSFRVVSPRAAACVLEARDVAVRLGPRLWLVGHNNHPHESSARNMPALGCGCVLALESR